MAKWSVLFYMNADHEDYYEEGLADKILNELNKIGSGDDLNIVVLLDRFRPPDTANPKKFHPSIYKIEYNKKITFKTTALKILPLEDMGNPKMLSKFISFCDAEPTCKADNYILVIWDHGGGFFIEGHKALSTEINTNFIQINDTIRERRNILGQLMYQPFTRKNKSILKRLELNEDDDDNEGYLFPSEIAAVVNSTIPGKLKLLIFDACWMATFETAFSLKAVTDYVIASENPLSNDGLDYTALKLLREHPPTTKDLCKLIVNNTINTRLKKEPFATVSAYDTRYIEKISDLLDKFSIYIIKEEMYVLLYLARKSCMNFYYDEDPRVGLDVIDMLYLFQNIRKQYTNDNADLFALEKDDFEVLVNEIIEVINRFIVISQTGEEMSKTDDVIKSWGAQGISIFFPENPFYFSYFKNVPDWYFDEAPGRHPFNSREWKKLLTAYFDWMQEDYGVHIKVEKKTNP